ncbi:Pre-mRNA-splicing factor prp46 [Cytospora mali]|uniref:Pre-mRNA-splicing factor PRP46 n=1 Tax=Cytospora mali TaxID=578113 RepID=A0A194VH00_CYTMA|nr:Pre-mRNA-splicing factor prp46 [Valsa mali var. pyri (nom. inval.)]
MAADTSTTLESLISKNAKATKLVYAESTGRKRIRLDPVAKPEPEADKDAIAVRLHAEYNDLLTLPEPLAAKQAAAAGARRKAKRPAGAAAAEGAPTPAEENTRKLIEGIPTKAPNGKPPGAGPQSSALVRRTPGAGAGAGAGAAGDRSQGGTQTTSLIRMSEAVNAQPKPEWHKPWKLHKVISGHLGWVRSMAVEPNNKWFVTGSGDRTIKIWDLASGQLRLTLTGHISTVRGLAVSPRHPYLFSCGEDKMVKCWDLETNKVIRHYHGHLSGVYTLALHPTLDVLVTGGRDGVARVWDMRTRSNIHVLSGHTGTVSSLICQEADPQVITGSLDSQVRLWDLAAGKSMGVLTHHKKGVRALASHPSEFTFATGSTGSIKQWKCPEGAFMQNFEGQNAIINTLSVNNDNIMFSGGDNGSMSFWDWKSGYRYQAMDTIAQPGSLDAENGVFCSTFDRSGLRLICGEADKTIKIWKPDDDATPQTHPIDWKPSLQRRRY